MVLLKLYEDDKFEYGLYVDDEECRDIDILTKTKWDWMKGKPIQRVYPPPNQTPEYYKKSASFIENELQPRCNKLKIELKDFPVPPGILGTILECELAGKITRKDTRAWIDNVTGLKPYKDPEVETWDFIEKIMKE